MAVYSTCTYGWVNQCVCSQKCKCSLIDNVVHHFLPDFVVSVASSCVVLSKDIKYVKLNSERLGVRGKDIVHTGRLHWPLEVILTCVQAPQPEE